MPKINLRVVTDSHEILDFSDEDGKQVHLERTKSYVFLPDSPFPDMVMLMGLHEIGEGTIDMNIDVKKEVLRARFNVDSIAITKKITPPPLKKD